MASSKGNSISQVKLSLEASGMDFTNNVTIGTGANPKNLTVNGNVNLTGDLTGSASAITGLEGSYQGGSILMDSDGLTLKANMDLNVQEDFIRGSRDKFNVPASVTNSVSGTVSNGDGTYTGLTGVGGTNNSNTARFTAVVASGSVTSLTCTNDLSDGTGSAVDNGYSIGETITVSGLSTTVTFIVHANDITIDANSTLIDGVGINTNRLFARGGTMGALTIGQVQEGLGSGLAIHKGGLYVDAEDSTGTSGNYGAKVVSTYSGDAVTSTTLTIGGATTTGSVIVTKDQTSSAPIAKELVTKEYVTSVTASSGFTPIVMVLTSQSNSAELYDINWFVHGDTSMLSVQTANRSKWLRNAGSYIRHTLNLNFTPGIYEVTFSYMTPTGSNHNNEIEFWFDIDDDGGNDGMEGTFLRREFSITATNTRAVSFSHNTNFHLLTYDITKFSTADNYRPQLIFKKLAEVTPSGSNLPLSHPDNTDGSSHRTITTTTASITSVIEF